MMHDTTHYTTHAALRSRMRMPASTRTRLRSASISSTRFILSMLIM